MTWLNSWNLQIFDIESEAVNTVMYGTFPGGVRGYIEDCEETVSVEELLHLLLFVFLENYSYFSVSIFFEFVDAL